MDTLTKKVALAILRERKAFFAEIEEERRIAHNRHQNFPYCKHGTFIGDPYGPDYLCGECEGWTEDEPNDYAIAIQRAKKAVAEYIDALVLLAQVMRITETGISDNDTEVTDALLVLRRAIRTNTIGRYEK